MPVDPKPPFRPDVLRPHLAAFALPQRVEGLRPKIADWAELLASGRADAHKETQLLPDLLTDFFYGYGVLGYTGPGRERAVHDLARATRGGDGKFADEVLGSFMPQRREYVVLRSPMIALPRREKSGHDCAQPILHMRVYKACGSVATERRK